MDDTRVLNTPIREEQPRADSPDAGASEITCHLAQPAGLDYPCIVVQEKNVLAIYLANCLIVNGGKVELPLGTWNAQNPVRTCLEVFERFGVIAVVVDDNDLVITVCRLVDRLNARPEQVQPVLCWHYYSDARSIVREFVRVDRASRAERPCRLE